MVLLFCPTIGLWIFAQNIASLDKFENKTIIVDRQKATRHDKFKNGYYTESTYNGSACKI